MGLLEYQAVPSLCDGAHDVWLCTFRAAPLRATGTVRKRQAVLPILHVQNHTCRVTLLQPARRAAVLGWTSPLAFGLIGLDRWGVEFCTVRQYG
jgi:hypothetical protein